MRAKDTRFSLAAVWALCDEQLPTPSAEVGRQKATASFISSYTTLHCSALLCTALYCSVLHCTALYCTVNVEDLKDGKCYTRLMEHHQVHKRAFSH